jgi:thiamine-phosphate pyrophosphorylase
MRRRHPLPTLWLMTDERQGDALLPAVHALPPGAGIIFRHYSLSLDARRLLFADVRRIAQKRGLLLMLAGPPSLARLWGADGVHGHHRRAGALLCSASVHNRAELRTARRADLIFISPVFPTRSHPDAPALGLAHFSRLCRLAPMPVIALGGLTARNARPALRAGAYGWAAIDGLTPGRN